MTEEKAIVIASDYIHRRLGPHPTLIGEPCSYELRGAKPGTSNTWTVLFRTVMLNSPDDVVDGDLMVIVDAVSGEAKFFDELFS
jgi:hypothetical protein